MAYLLERCMQKHQKSPPGIGLSVKCNGYKDLCAKFMKDDVFQFIGEIKKILEYTGLKQINVVPKYDEIRN